MQTFRTPTEQEIEQAREEIARLQRLPRALGMPPESGLLYQPIPFPGFEDLPCERNSSEHRLGMLLDRVPYKSAKVLDLGCANGFFLLRLAQLDGALALGRGVDRYAGNIGTTQLVARLHGLEKRLTFTEGEIDLDSVRSFLAEDEWDVCHLLSVHHHLLRDHGLETTRELLRALYDGCGLVVIEQGSLTQEEYETWTGREEPFTTRSFSRLLSMLEACGVPPEQCYPVGMGLYLSGRRDDLEGAGRAILAYGRRAPAGVVADHRKAHKNGIYMEILEVRDADGETEVWKNVVTGDSLAERELSALRRLADEAGFPRLSAGEHQAAAEARGGLLRLEGLDLRAVTPEDVERMGPSLRHQALERLNSLARAGVVHNEINPLHLQLTGDDRLVLLDFETAYFTDESREEWKREVADPNPVLGVGAYPRELLDRDPLGIDLVSTDAVLGEWGLPLLEETERRLYRTLIRSRS